MTRYEDRGAEIRSLARALVVDFMKATPDCQPGAEGMRLASLFRACGFDWGDYPKATSSNQQYWVVALMKKLEEEGIVEQVVPSGPWRLASGLTRRSG